MEKSITADLVELKKIKSLSFKLLKKERTKFFVGFSIIAISFSYISLSVANTYSGTISAFANNIATKSSFFFKTDSNLSKNLDDNAIKQAVLNSNSVSLNPSLTPVKENGQISAISSGRVSYTKNEYTVARGDTLFIIAEKVYGDRDAWFKIATENNIKNPDLIEVGMMLKIPR